MGLEGKKVLKINTRNVSKFIQTANRLLSDQIHPDSFIVIVNKLLKVKDRPGLTEEEKLNLNILEISLRQYLRRQYSLFDQVLILFRVTKRDFLD